MVTDGGEPRLHIDVHTDAADVRHLRISGEIDLQTAGMLREALQPAIAAAGATTILLDFAQVGYCDSTGIHAIDQAYGDAAAKNTRLQVMNLQPGVRRVLQLVGLEHTLTGVRQSHQREQPASGSQ